MKLIHLAYSVLISICACAQNTENLLKNHFNPVFIKELNTIKLYSQINIINPEFGIHNSKYYIFIKAQKRTFQIGCEQYGYKLFNDSEYSISSNQKLNGRTNLGLSMNLHHLKIYETEKHTALTFNIGLSYKVEQYQLYIFLENPINNSYIKNDLESRFILNTLYYWSTNLHSDLQFEESIHTGFHLKHRLSYNYQNSFNLSILQAFRPFEYGFRLGYKKGAFQWYSQYKKQAWTYSTGIGLIYQPIHE